MYTLKPNKRKLRMLMLMKGPPRLALWPTVRTSFAFCQKPRGENRRVTDSPNMTLSQFSLFDLRWHKLLFSVEHSLNE